jgi:hypothetical protein
MAMLPRHVPDPSLALAENILKQVWPTFAKFLISENNL